MVEIHKNSNIHEAAFIYILDRMIKKISIHLSLHREMPMITEAELVPIPQQGLDLGKAHP